LPYLPRGEIPELDETPTACPHCGAVALVVSLTNDGPDWAASETRAKRAYRDDSFPERECDHCGKTYQGPAVYCSLECAMADA
jgi:hypothetical protein